MIKRIVKMTFQPDRVDDFLKIFEESSPHIRNFEGCRRLELWRCRTPDNVLFTYSFWDSEAALDRYRQSDLFRDTWKRTKPLFDDRPRAWSIDVIRELGGPKN